MSKYYAVIRGRKPGVYNSWKECKVQTNKYPKALYRSYNTKKEAEEAFKNKCIKKEGVTKKKGDRKRTRKKKVKPYERKSISVDGSTRDNTGLTEYQGVCTETGEKLFGSKLYTRGTNNLAEFIALVVGLRYLEKNKLGIPIYTDSLTAMAWVRNKKVNTDLEDSDETKEILEDTDMALDYIKEVDIKKFDIRKWNTKEWGDSKADFGRK